VTSYNCSGCELIAPKVEGADLGPAARARLRPWQDILHVPRMRTATSDDYLTPESPTPSTRIGIFGIRHHSVSRIGGSPIYQIVPENAMAFHLDTGRKGSATGPDDMTITSGIASVDTTPLSTSRPTHMTSRSRRNRSSSTRKLDPQVRVVPEAGGIVLFSGNHLHSTVPNTSGRTRFSADFRVVHIDDVVARREAPNIDSEYTGITLRDLSSRQRPPARRRADRACLREGSGVQSITKYGVD